MTFKQAEWDLVDWYGPIHGMVAAGVARLGRGKHWDEWARDLDRPAINPEHEERKKQARKAFYAIGKMVAP